MNRNAAALTVLLRIFSDVPEDEVSSTINFNVLGSASSLSVRSHPRDILFFFLDEWHADGLSDA